MDALKEIQKSKKEIEILTQKFNSFATLLNILTDEILIAQDNSYFQMQLETVERFSGILETLQEVVDNIPLVWKRCDKLKNKRKFGNIQKEKAYRNALNCLFYGYDKSAWNSCGLAWHESDEVWQEAKKSIYKLCIGKLI